MKQGIWARSVTIACIAFINCVLNCLWHFGDCFWFNKRLSNTKGFEVWVVNLVWVCSAQNRLLSGFKFFLEKVNYFGLLMSQSHVDLFFGCCLCPWLCGAQKCAWLCKNISPPGREIFRFGLDRAVKALKPIHIQGHTQRGGLESPIRNPVPLETLYKGLWRASIFGPRQPWAPLAAPHFKKFSCTHYTHLVWTVVTWIAMQSSSSISSKILCVQ